MMQDRRQFIKNTALVTGLSVFNSEHFIRKWNPKMPISCNQYAWHTFYRRENKQWDANLDEFFVDYASSGLTAFEPGVGGLSELKRLIPVLKKFKIAMPSLYVNSTLHDEKLANESISSILDIADEAMHYGTNIIVTNPNPLKWGGSENKSDEQLIFQASKLDELGMLLRKRGMKLAYHSHDIEFRVAAREFHHMLLATDPQNVSLCLDVHWVYRGSGNSQVALFDIVKLYGKRIVELHIRQSKNGIWQETFGEGDIDYVRLANELKKQKISPQLVLEQCLEKDSPNTINAVEAHKKDLTYLREVFG